MTERIKLLSISQKTLAVLKVLRIIFEVDHSLSKDHVEFGQIYFNIVCQPPYPSLAHLLLYKKLKSYRTL